MIRKLLFIFLVVFYSAHTHASDMSGLIYILGLQVIFMLLPLALPLFFLKNLSQKVKMYFVFLVLVYGINGLTAFPISIYSQAAIWLSAAEYSWNFSVIQQLISICLSIIAMNKYGSRLASCFTKEGE